MLLSISFYTDIQMVYFIKKKQKKQKTKKIPTNHMKNKYKYICGGYRGHDDIEIRFGLVCGV
jgi:hypothetical protein